MKLRGVYRLRGWIDAATGRENVMYSFTYTTMAYLVVSKGEGERPARVALDEALVIGRSPECGMSVNDRRLSRQHCRLEPIVARLPEALRAGDLAKVEPAWALIDLNSSNGTTVRGQRVNFERLRDGDEILIGRVRMIFHTGRMPQARPSDPNASRAGSLGDGAAATGATGTASVSAAASSSAHDTLSDSRAYLAAIRANDSGRRLPTVEPNPDLPEKRAKRTESLAFRRPPARPKVHRRSKSVAARLHSFLRAVNKSLREATSD